MEFTDWLIIAVILIAIFYAKFYQPGIYTPIANAVDSAARSAMSMAESAITHARADNSTNSTPLGGQNG